MLFPKKNINFTAEIGDVMKLVENIKTFFWSLRMHKIAKRIQRNRQMIGLDMAKSIGIYYHHTGKESCEIIGKFANYLKSKGIAVKILGYLDTVEKSTDIADNQMFNYFYKSNLAFNRIPNNANVYNFIKQPFDIFFDLSLSDHFQNLYIANSSVASFKIGRSCEWGLKIFDFTLELQKETDLTEFVKIILNYLSVFNQPDSTPIIEK